MKKTNLNTGWTFRVINAKENEADGTGIKLPTNPIEAEVPGSVYATLLEKGLIPDPYYRTNELEVLPVMQNDFEYSTSFVLGDESLDKDALLLIFEGIDTLADIYLNEQLFGSVKNMHRRYEYDITGLAKKGENSLRIYLKSPTKYIKEENEKVYCGGVHEAMEGFPHLRKAHCMFGWDWGPRIPDAGIFRPVYLLEVDRARLEDLRIRQKHEADRVTLSFENRLDVKKAGKYKLKIKLTGPDGSLREDTTELIWLEAGSKILSNSILVENPELWWPNGYGAQPLYTVETELYTENDKLLDSSNRRIGLRTMTVNTEKDEWGNCFAHEVNGVKIFAMGADYIPEDNLFSRINEGRTRRLLEDAAAANHNSIRVWGGGYYPDDYFFDICDELGLIVWQDFMFACASYELTAEFDREIRAEVKDNVRRLRHHASLGLWCGNNEMETQTYDGCWKPSIKQKADYLTIFEYIIPQALREEDDQTFYWPSSPSSCGAFDNPWDENRGDAHYWDVWHGNKPFTDYRKYHFRYLSEFGFQSFPDLKTIESFTEKEDRNVFSRVMEMHQRNVAANGKILNYMSATYLYANNFERFVYLSQLLQADAIRYGVEHFRRNRGRCMGAVVWQLNDIWPVASWASIDYYGNWKALHYAEKKMFAPVLISCEEHGEIDLKPYCITENLEPLVPSIRLNISNESRQEVTGLVKWQLRNAAGEPVKIAGLKCSDSFVAGIPALTAVYFDAVEFPKLDPLSHYVSYSFEITGRIVSEGTALFTAPKHFKFEDPELSVRIEGNKVFLSAKRFAKNVEIRRKLSSHKTEERLLLSDNFFDMNPGEKTVEILEGVLTPENIEIQYVYEKN